MAKAEEKTEWVDLEDYATEVAEACGWELDTIVDLFLKVLEDSNFHTLRKWLIPVIEDYQESCHADD